MTIGIKEAEARLQRDLRRFEVAIAKAVIPELTENQFSALVSLTFNIGIRSGDIQGAGMEFLRWNRVKGKVVPELAKRREREQ